MAFDKTRLNSALVTGLGATRLKGPEHFAFFNKKMTACT